MPHFPRLSRGRAGAPDMRECRVELCRQVFFVRLEIAQKTVHRCDSADAGRCERRVYTAAKIRRSDPRCAAAPRRRATIASQHRTTGIGYPASSDRSAMSHRATARHSRRTNSRSRAIQSARRRPARAQAARRANRPSLMVHQRVAESLGNLLMAPSDGSTAITSVSPVTRP
jgi:hypothetical protein